MSSSLFAPVVSITTTKRRRFFWAAWWSGPPSRIPFRRPDASDGGASTEEEALANAEARAGASLGRIDKLWARAWIRILRGEHPFPTRASQEPAAAREPRAADAEPDSVWAILGVGRDASLVELKVAYKKRVLETHPDQGGNDVAFQRVVRAYAEAERRLRRPRRR